MTTTSDPTMTSVTPCPLPWCRNEWPDRNHTVSFLVFNCDNGDVPPEVVVDCDETANDAAYTTIELSRGYPRSPNRTRPTSWSTRSVAPPTWRSWTLQRTERPRTGTETGSHPESTPGGTTASTASHSLSALVMPAEQPRAEPGS